MSEVLTSLLDKITTWWDLNVHGQMTIAAVIQMAAAVIGFPVVIYQLLQLRRNLQGATQDKLYAHYTEICKLFIQNPALRPYFYGRGEVAGEIDLVLDTKPPAQPRSGVVVDPSVSKTREGRAQVDFMCEVILGLVEHAVLQKKNVPGDAWNNCWRPYALERLKKSEALEKFFNPNAHWYSRKMRKAMKSIKCDLDQMRLEESEWLEKFFKPNVHWYSPTMRKMRKAMKSTKRDLDQIRVNPGRRWGIVAAGVFAIVAGLDEIIGWGSVVAIIYLGILSKPLEPSAVTALVGACYGLGGVFILTFRKWGAALGMALIAAGILGRIYLVATGVAPSTGPDPIKIAVGGAIALALIGYVASQWRRFH